MNDYPMETNQWVDEYIEGVRYGLYGKILVEETSSFQKIKIIASSRYGKGLLLDNCWMTAEKQDRHYHEPLVHPAMTSANHIEKVLIIGGGDGGSARECLRYKEVTHLDLVEIDQRVVELSQQYLTCIGGKAWQDPRLHIHFQDGIEWVQKAEDNSYNVILIDGSDPVGPAKGLFNQNFFENCRRILSPDGVFATQSESPEAFCQLHVDIIQVLRTVFDYADPLYGWVPMYPSGWWSWTVASMHEARFHIPKKNRILAISKECEIWSPKWQQGAFQTMPAYIERELKK